VVLVAWMMTQGSSHRTFATSHIVSNSNWRNIGQVFMKMTVKCGQNARLQKTTNEQSQQVARRVL
jgi:hypothetical protein